VSAKQSTFQRRSAGSEIRTAPFAVACSADNRFTLNNRPRPKKTVAPAWRWACAEMRTRGLTDKQCRHWRRYGTEANASTPLINGMMKSSTATSGVVATALPMASLPSAASATTSQPG